MDPQLTHTVLMISPDFFGFNEETMSDNPFMQRSPSQSEKEIRDKAMEEFHAMADQLRREGLEVITCPSQRATPDAVFPNNWISFHPSQIVLYPMKAPTRRAERQLKEVKQAIEKSGHSLPEKTLDLTTLENQETFLEGTGSLVFDRPSHVAFAALSQRTHREALDHFAKEMGFDLVIFKTDVYHTNVVMSLGENFCVICLEAIPDKAERKKVEGKLSALGKEMIPISLNQMNHFCGNILQVISAKGPKIILSQTAFDHFTPAQRQALQKHGQWVVVQIPQIETTGGGSARCMLAEVFALQPPANRIKK